MKRFVTPLPVALSGDEVFQTEVTDEKWMNDEPDTFIKGPELAAMRTLIERAG